MDLQSQSLSRIVENLGRPRILVIGDLILDRYVWGNAERISQEAPVILLRADRREERLGGAASVAMMLAALGAEVQLCGVVGDDDAGLRCRELLDEHGILHDMVLVDPSRPTTLKERYIGRAQHKHPQQMMRVDYEVRDSLSETVVDRWSGPLAQAVGSCDIVLISDYDKGVCTPELIQKINKLAKETGRRVIADPIRGGDYATRYQGVSAMTPNRTEAQLATGIAIEDIPSALRAAEQLRRTVGMEVGIVTLDKEGMVLADANGRREHFPGRPREVYDITGAGDMVLAVLGMVLAAGNDYEKAILIANTAGGLEVEKIGVATITRDEILNDLSHGENVGRNKLVDRDNIAQELRRHRQRDKKVVFTNGCFDILHAGHVHILNQARLQGDLLVVGLNSDQSVRRLGKGDDRPINDQYQRAAVLSALECVDYVCVFDESTPLELIMEVQPDVLVKGSDYRPEDVVGRDVVVGRGGRLHLVPLVPGKSTTAIVAKIRESRAA